MKKFIVDTGDKKYAVHADTYDEAIEAVKVILKKDEAAPLQTVNALIEDEKAAVEAYNVAIENLKGKIPDESMRAIIAIRDDENRHIENLQAVINGNVTEKNLEDSKTNDEKVDITKMQEWVDYDMKHYGKISEKTNDILRENGLSVVKSKYGQYEVVAHK